MIDLSVHSVHSVVLSKAKENKRNTRTYQTVSITLNKQADLHLQRLNQKFDWSRPMAAFSMAGKP